MLALALTGCGVAPRYRNLGGRFEVDRALDLGIVADGEPLVLEVTDANGRPVSGEILLLGNDAVVSDSAGRLAVPISRTLVRSNPPVRLITPPRIGAISLRAQFAFNCDEVGKPVTRITAVAVDAFDFTDSGPDRVYSEPGVDPAERTRVAALLSEERALLAQLSGASPPPVAALLLAKDGGVRTSADDAAGRQVWTIAPSRLHDDRELVGSFTHEWTHSLLQKRFRYGSSQETRYVEDGLCELMAHLACVRIRKSGASSPVASSRLDELLAQKDLPARADLLALSRAHDFRRYPTLPDAIVGGCEQDAVVGYGLGLAWWLDRYDVDPSFPVRFFDAFRRDRDPGPLRLAHVLDGMAGDGLQLRSVDVQYAEKVLQRHR